MMISSPLSSPLLILFLSLLLLSSLFLSPSSFHPFLLRQKKNNQALVTHTSCLACTDPTSLQLLTLLRLVLLNLQLISTTPLHTLTSFDLSLSLALSLRSLLYHCSTKTNRQITTTTTVPQTSQSKNTFRPNPPSLSTPLLPPSHSQQLPPPSSPNRLASSHTFITVETVGNVLKPSQAQLPPVKLRPPTLLLYTPPFFSFFSSAMEPIRSSYVEYGQGNMLNLDAGTIKRKIDSNEYDDEIIQEIQPNGKRTCSPMNHSPFSNFGTPTQTTPKSSGPAWSQPNPSPLLRTAAHHATALNHMNNQNGSHLQANMQGYQTPESGLSSNTASPYNGGSNMDMDMESDSTVAQDASPTNAMFRASLASPILSQEYHQQQLQQQHLQQQQQQQQQAAAAAQNGTGLLPSALPVPGQGTNSNGNNEYVPVHGRSMQIPSCARVPLNEANEARRYRDQRWSSCIYGVDTRIGQGMMI